MRRPGHHRPVGSLTAPARFSWAGEPPRLGDLACETIGPAGDPWELQRAFLLVGIEETTSLARPYQLIFERLNWEAALRLAADESQRYWTWYRVRP